jgi:hypothetical protein
MDTKHIEDARNHMYRALQFAYRQRMVRRMQRDYQLEYSEAYHLVEQTIEKYGYPDNLEV